MTVDTRRRTGEETRRLLLGYAVRAFRRRGVDAVTLEDVADEVGVTRQAVLHHFTSKEELLRRAVEPCVAAMDRLLDEFEASTPLTPRTKRLLLTELVELCAVHRDGAALLTGDVTALAHLGPELQPERRSRRLVGLIGDAQRGPTAPAKVLAALGVITRPLAAPDDVVDFGDARVRRQLVDCALAVLRTPSQSA